MSRKSLFLSIALCGLLLPGRELPAENKTTSFTAGEKAIRSQAVSLTEQAAEFWLEKGRQETIRELNKIGGLFDRGEIFVFACDMKGELIAHRDLGKNPCLLTLSEDDTKGALLKKKMFTLARTEESGWITCYCFYEKTGKFSRTNLFILKMGNIIFCSSYFVY